MSYVAKTIKFEDGHQLKIIADESPDSPREWDNLGTMVCFHRRYQLGDKHEFDTPEDFREFLHDEDIAVVLPLYLYDHSGITMSIHPFSCSWDSGQVGWIYVTNETVRGEYGNLTPDSIKLAKRILEGEVEAYNQYIRGDIYGFELLAPHNCDCDECSCEGEHVDSCWGFYGSDPVENGMVDHLAAKYRKEIMAGDYQQKSAND